MKAKRGNIKNVKPKIAAPKKKELKEEVKSSHQIKLENQASFIQAYNTKNKGRPIEFNEDIAQYICDEMMEGRTLMDICDNEKMPRACTVYKWMDKYDTFNSQILRARQHHAMMLTDKITAIGEELYSQCLTADDIRSTNDRLRAMTEIAKVRVGANQWRASRYNPRVLGDHIKYSGTIEANTTVTQLDCSDEQLQARLKDIMSGAQQRIESTNNK